MTKHPIPAAPFAPAILLACLLLGLAPQPTRADGIYIPEKAVQKLPSIPLQRAIIVHKDQTERLIVESTLSAEGQRFGWIIPVPAQPTAIEEASSGLITTLSFHTQPKITHDVLGEIWPLIGIPFAVVTVWALLVWFEDPAKAQATRPIVRVLGAVAILFLLVFLFLPHLGKSVSPPTMRDGINVESAQVVGNYDVTTLQADSADALNRWLDQNGFAALPEAGRVIAGDYIKQNWHFVTARLQRNGSGLTQPHPLSITFPATTAVYPMRLTALASSPVALELYVISDQRAQADDLDTEFCDVFKSAKRTSDTESPRFEAREYHKIVGHPQLDTLLWDKCCLTTLRGSLQPDQMTRDIYLQWQHPTPHLAHFYSPRGSREIATIAAMILWTAILPLALHRAQSTAPLPLNLRRRFYFTRIFRPVLAVSLLAYLAVYMVLPQTDVEAISRDRRWLSFSNPIDANTEAICAFALQSNGSTERFRQLLAEHFRYTVLVNGSTYGRVIEQDSPGNYQVQKDADGFRLIQYDDEMTQRILHIPTDPASYPIKDLESQYNRPFDPKEYESQRSAAQHDIQAFLAAPSRAAWERLMQPAKPWYMSFARVMEIVQLGRQHPQQVLPLLVEDARAALNTESEGKIWLCTNLLGYIMQVPPPLDFNRPADAHRFLRQAEQFATRN